MKRGEIYVARFPLGGTVGAKTRPVLLLTDPVGPVPEVLTGYFSSIIPDPLLSSDLLVDPALPEHQSANLKIPSVLRLHKLATLHQRDVFRAVGVLSTVIMQEVEARLRVLLGL